MSIQDSIYDVKEWIEKHADKYVKVAFTDICSCLFDMEEEIDKLSKDKKELQITLKTLVKYKDELKYE